LERTQRVARYSRCRVFPCFSVPHLRLRWQKKRNWRRQTFVLWCRQMSERAVLFEAKDGVGIVTLNQADTGNRMTPELLDSFSEVMDEVVKLDELRALIITGRGRCFSAGADLDGSLQRGGSLTPQQASYAMYIPFLKVLDVRVPVIAALNGHTVGGG